MIIKCSNEKYINSDRIASYEIEATDNNKYAIRARTETNLVNYNFIQLAVFSRKDIAIKVLNDLIIALSKNNTYFNLHNVVKEYEENIYG